MSKSRAGASTHAQLRGEPDALPERCGFVERGSTGGGIRDRFCDAPAERGSSYCDRHRRLCTRAPATAEGRAIAAALRRAARDASAPPGELAHLESASVPDPAPVEETSELLVLLDRRLDSRREEE